jgi:hypothetical protein
MGIRTIFHPGDAGTFTVQRRDEDVEPTLERNKKLQNTPQTKTESFHHVASIPAIVIEKWITEEGIPILSMPAHEFQRFIRRRLRDPEWMWLKTTDKRL